MVMSDRIAIMREGRIEQIGTPDEIYNAPINSFVAEFMGEVNLFAVRTTADGRLEALDIGASFASPQTELKAGLEGTLMVRPEAVRFLGPDDAAESSIEATVLNEYALGSRMQYSLRVGAQTVSVEKLREDRYHGELDIQVRIGWDAADSRLLGLGDG